MLSASLLDSVRGNSVSLGTVSWTATPGGGVLPMWWVIHMCRGFDPLFSLWQDRARSFWGVFSHPPTRKRSFEYKSSQNSIFLALKYHFSLDLFGSNFQWPAAHPPAIFGPSTPPGRPPASLSGDDGATAAAAPPRWYFDELIIWVLSYFVTVLSFQITGRPPGGFLRQSLAGESLQLSHVIWRICIAWHEVFPLATLPHCSKRVNCCRSGLVVIEGIGSLNFITRDCPTVSKGADSCRFYSYKWLLLLTWFNFNPRMDK